MKILIAAVALIVAFPAAAQTDPHAGHKASEHEKHKSGAPEGGMDCCKDKDGNGRMDCCDKAATGAVSECCKKKAGAKGHDRHSGH